MDHNTYNRYAPLIKLLTLGKCPIDLVFPLYLPIGVISLTYLDRKLYISKYFKRTYSLIIPAAVLYGLFSQNDQRTNILSLLSKLVDYQHNRVIKNLVGDVLGISVIIGSFNFIQNLFGYSLADLKSYFTAELFRFSKNISYVTDMLEKEKNKAEKGFEEDLKPKSRNIGNVNKILPRTGMDASSILELMKGATNSETNVWRNGKVSGSVYYDWTSNNNSHLKLLNEAFGYYSIANPLHTDIWPSVMKFESEIISMAASLVNGGSDCVCGATTSGGTESIVLAIKAHRDYYMQKYGIKNPELIAATSAHAAVDKACEMMGIRLVRVDIDPRTYKINLNSVKKAISSNTILIYSSAPSYPQGVIDPISDLAKIAYSYDVGLHVDCCLGGFVLPFAKRLGYNIPDFDFSLKGVTSMSLDTHKYGYALKGTSVILYANREIRQAQYFCYSDWSGGLYTTPTIAGSRSGGLIAQCWASLMSLGEEGYLKITKEIMESTKILASGIAKIDGLRVIGNAEAMIVCMEGVDSVNIYNIVDSMAKKGWSLSSHQNPACAHICVTAIHVGHEKNLLDDLNLSVEEVKRAPNMKSGKAAIYGMTSTLPAGPVNEMLRVYNDVVLSV